MSNRCPSNSSSMILTKPIPSISNSLSQGTSCTPLMKLGKGRSPMPPKPGIQAGRNLEHLTGARKIIAQADPPRAHEGGMHKGNVSGAPAEGLNQRKGAGIGAPRAPDLPLPRFLPRTPTCKPRQEHQEQVVRSTPPSHARGDTTTGWRGAAQEFPHSSRGRRGARNGARDCQRSGNEEIDEIRRMPARINTKMQSCPNASTHPGCQCRINARRQRCNARVLPDPPAKVARYRPACQKNGDFECTPSIYKPAASRYARHTPR